MKCRWPVGEDSYLGEDADDEADYGQGDGGVPDDSTETEEDEDDGPLIGTRTAIFCLRFLLKKSRILRP